MRLFSPIVMATFGFGTLPASAGEIALSLVHERSRIDIPASAITSIEAYATLTIVVQGTGERRDYPDPRVQLCYTAEIQAQICRLTQQIVEQPLSLVVDCEPVSQPVVREPLCGPCLQISANDPVEANALLQRLKKGSKRRCPPVS